MNFRKLLISILLCFCQPALGHYNDIINALDEITNLSMMSPTSCSLYRSKEPVVNEIFSLESWSSILESDGINSLSDMSNYFQSQKLPDGNFTKTYPLPRYIYSEKWGWIDLKHFTVAAKHSQRTRLPWLVLVRGETVETEQAIRNSSSAYSYEDLTSNALGSYFPYFLKEYKREGESDKEVLFRFFETIGVVNNPMEVAPNRDRIPNDVDASGLPSWAEINYRPLFTNPDAQRNLTDNNIQAYIDKFKDWGSLIHSGP
jgi:hypothetical protein